MASISYTQRVTALGTLTIYEGHNSRLSIQELQDGGTPIYKLEYSNPIYAPNALFYPEGDSIALLLNFQGLCIEAGDWPAVKTATDKMLALWQEYKDSKNSTCL